MKVNEIFESIQGEGPDVGRRAVFVRLGGCNRRCAFCDTQYAWYHWIEVSVDQVIDAIRTYPDIKMVVITGGEPMMQKREVEELSERLRELGYFVALETNGDFEVDIEKFDRVVVSPKEKEVLRKWLGKKGVVVKIVVDERNIDEIMEECYGYDNVWFLPEGVIPIEIIENSRLILQKMKEYGMDGRLSMRAHVIFGVR